MYTIIYALSYDWSRHDLNPVSYTHLDVYKRQQFITSMKPAVTSSPFCCLLFKWRAETCQQLNYMVKITKWITIDSDCRRYRLKWGRYTLLWLVQILYRNRHLRPAWNDWVSGKVPADNHERTLVEFWRQPDVRLDRGLRFNAHVTELLSLIHI